MGGIHNFFSMNKLDSEYITYGVARFANKAEDRDYACTPELNKSSDNVSSFGGNKKIIYIHKP